MFRQCNIFFLCDFGNVPTLWHYLFFYVTLELFQQYGIICFSIGLGTVPTVWHYLFFYWTLELFRQCGIICYSTGLWNFSESVALFVFHFSIGL